MNKKIIALLFALIFTVCCFTACGADKATDGNAHKETALADTDTQDESVTDDTQQGEETSADEESTITTAFKTEEEPAITDPDSTFATLPSPEKVKPFADFTTQTIDGKDVDNSIFEGNKLTMVNVWGTFCNPCIEEMPYIQQLSESYADKGFAVIGIICDTCNLSDYEMDEERIEKAKDIIAQTGVKYDNLLANGSLNIAGLENIYTYPTTYFLDEDGNIIGSSYVGSRTYDQWSAIVEAFL